ncbi:MAG: hypothetical protein ABSE51_18445 [Terracidiphilus sp.]|jgi:hypothetical protein
MMKLLTSWTNLQSFLLTRAAAKFLRPPIRLHDFKNIHSHEAIIICGCGVSAREFDKPDFARTIGVNDFGRRFDPDYLLVIDAKKKFPPDRYRYIENSRALFVFSDHRHRLEHSRLVHLPLQKSAQPKLDNPNALYAIGKPITSPFIAVALAAHMGARLIGMIGVDFTKNHFFDESGLHILTPQLEGIDKRFSLLSAALSCQGVDFYNLSKASALCSVPKMSMDEFVHSARALQSPLQHSRSLEWNPASLRYFA